MQRQPTFFTFERSPTGTPIGRKGLSLHSDGSRRCVFLGPTAIFVYDEFDKVAESACIATLSRARLAFDVDIASAFGVHRNTVARYVREFATSGIQGLVPGRRGPHGPSKVNASVVDVIAQHPELGPRPLARLIAEETGVDLSPAHVGRLRARYATAPDSSVPEQGQLVLDTAKNEARPYIGEETATAGLVEPNAVLPDEEERGVDMGATLFYPALSAVGLLDAAAQHYRLPRSSVFGVRATVLSVFFLTLLGKSTVESGKHLARASFGALIGTGVGPCVKTLRRKLSAMVAQKAAGSFGESLARRWVESGVVATAYLYVDGHVKAYTGKRELQEVWNAQRRMPLPGIMGYFVGDQSGRPLLFVTGEVSNSLAKALPEIVDRIRDVLGDRTFTVIFDRGGYDGSLFTWLQQQGVDFITYQRGTPGLAPDQFRRREARFEGRRTRFMIAEDDVHVQKSGPWRRVVVLTPKDGHQTPILTSINRDVLGAARIACLMFARWRQENFFCYMRQHMGIDQLVSYAAEDVPGAKVPNPERQQLKRELRGKRKQASALRKQIADDAVFAALPASRHGFRQEREGAVCALREVESQLQVLQDRLRACPTHLPAADVGRTRHAMRLEQKTLVDLVKITAYNAEEWTLDILRRHYPNHHDVRDLLRSFARLSGKMTSGPHGLTITIEAPDTPIHRRALIGLCNDLNAFSPTYPGTRVPVSYAVAVHHTG